MHRTLILALGLLSATVIAQAPPPEPLPAGVAQMPYRNPKLPLDQRVDDLLHRMTLEEKASQLVNQSRAIPRLGIPAYDWWNEALHGVAYGTATVFPEPIGLAATFDPDSIHKMGVVIGTEGRAKYNMAVRAGERTIFQGLTFWSPNINIFRDPRWGRGMETYGEDPFLTAHMGVAFVKGVQGDDPHYYRAIATPKHYAVHSGPESTRHTADVKVSLHDMADTYFPAFRATVVEAKAASVMCVYNSVNGEPGCANTFLLKDTLRKNWGFRGYVVSDCDAVADIAKGHKFVPTLAEAAAVSLKAGTDNDCADFLTIKKDASDYQRYIDAVKEGHATEADIDTALRRLLEARFRLGMFDPVEMVPYANIPDSANNTAASRALALKLAEESMVLLKNDGTLPLSPRTKKIAVIGPLADQIIVLEGNYNGRSSHYVNLLDGVRKQFPAAHIVYEPGTNFLHKPIAIEPEVLSHDGKPGLLAEYFADESMKGQPILTQVDSQINYGLTRNLPAGIHHVFARWSGTLTPRESGKYTLRIHGHAARLFLGGKLLGELTKPGTSDYVETMTLKAGHAYPIAVEYHGGTTLDVRLQWVREIPDALDRAVRAAREADVVIASVGITPELEGEEMKVDVPGFSGGDRTSLDLPAEERELVKAVKTTGKPLVAVLMNGSALSVNWLAEDANAILEAWYPGEEGGTAIARTLAGVNNPSGKLPVTVYKSVDQLPLFDDYNMANRTYRYFHGEPLFPFGFGLSYAHFAYSKLALSKPIVAAGSPLSADVTVRNTSKRAGDAVVQFYIIPPQKEGMPLRALRAFKRINVKAGATSRVHVDFNPRDLSFVSPEGKRIIAEGDYTLTAGDGQPGTQATTVKTIFKIKGNTTLPD
ncbi:MAG: glycoside hydrolase family 3 C-terminal domain-containing protein [Acidobacteria bacterium]|nr:glycoside hydrolase family 3 C-terminal domain-containing protein [Acidobacteriota bacterium]